MKSVFNLPADKGMVKFKKVARWMDHDEISRQTPADMVYWIEVL